VVRLTKIAMDKLAETLQELTMDPKKAIRVIPSSTTPNQLDLVLDVEREGDRVVKDDLGTKLLLIGSDISAELDEIVLDYQETSEGSRFMLRED
jgi:Fe-S cluster assembly iron-binding protein IscA